jgi:hypothetical protein
MKLEYVSSVVKMLFGRNTTCNVLRGIMPTDTELDVLSAESVPVKELTHFHTILFRLLATPNQPSK